MAMAIFKGGVHPEYRKELTASLAISAAPLPEKVVIPLQQHIGAPCEPLVEVGDAVKTGQKIGESEGFVSAPVHASISGRVTAIGPYNHPLGRKVAAVTIESDGQDEWDGQIGPLENYVECRRKSFVMPSARPVLSAWAVPPSRSREDVAAGRQGYRYGDHQRGGVRALSHR